MGVIGLNLNIKLGGGNEKQRVDREKVVTREESIQKNIESSERVERVESSVKRSSNRIDADERISPDNHVGKKSDSREHGARLELGSTEHGIDSGARSTVLIREHGARFGHINFENVEFNGITWDCLSYEEQIDVKMMIHEGMYLQSAFEVVAQEVSDRLDEAFKMRAAGLIPPPELEPHLYGKKLFGEKNENQGVSKANFVAGLLGL